MTGTHNLGFERLVRKMDEVAMKEDVIIQIGNTHYKPRYAEYFDFLGMDEIHRYIERAEVVVTHGGIGCISDSLKHNKPTIVVPRLRKFKEHTNNHQLDLTKELERKGRIIAVYDIDELDDALEKAKSFEFKQKKKTEDVINIIREYLGGISGSSEKKGRKE
jgi:UDP-N-acetylglucosamine transferase subunit ALG13